ncbi:ABC transporter permease, partial [Streptomyces niveiscabiei]
MTRIIAWLAAAFLLLPLLVVIPISFTPERYLSLPTDSVSLRHYGSLVSDGRWSKSIVDSLLVGIGAMVLATVMGTAFA